MEEPRADWPRRREQPKGRLPRFFFHIRDGGRLNPDRLGVELASAAAVHPEAVRLATEMLQEGGDAFLVLKVEVVDEHEELVLRLSFADAASNQFLG